MIDRKTIAAMIGPTLKRDQIAAILQVKPDTMRKNYESRPDFPRPVVRFSRKNVQWDAADIERWLKTQRARA